MKRCSIISFFILLNQINGEEMELVAGHVLFRHGDRTPIVTFPTDPVKEKDWPNGFGQLTTAGIEQQYRLGKYLRTRYDAILNRIYISSEIHVRSTDYDRTLMSAESNLIGLYSLSNISHDKLPIQPIPIHTVSINQDFLFGENDCPRLNQIPTEIFQVEEMKNLNTYYEPFFKKLQFWTNLTNVSIYNTGGVPDTIFVEHIYNRTPAWADDNVQKNLSDISDFSFHFSFTSNDTRRVRGGPLIQDMWINMNNSNRGQPFWKVKMYSAHDSTVSAVLSFLGINYAHQPQYASALFVDVYRQKSTYFVKVEYLNVTDSNKPYPYLLDGCPAVECPFDTFTTIYQPRFPKSVDIECAKKSSPVSPGCESNKKLIVILIVVSIVIGIIIFVIFGWFYLQRRERHQSVVSPYSLLEMVQRID